MADGYGGGEATSVCDATGMVLVGGDCDDADATISPDADEVCDGIDNDCSGDIDEEAIDQGTWYPDFDADGFGSEAWPTDACEAPAGYVADATDCDDYDAQVHPDAEEVCNGLDDNCDGAVDDETATDALTWYADSDGDGHGDAGSTLVHCDWQEGYVALDDDCNDSDGAISPAAEDLCDGVDNDCDGAIDHDGWLPGDYEDLDDVMENAPDGAHVCLGEGTFSGSSYHREGSLTLQGSGSEVTVIDADYDQFVYFGDRGDFGLIDLEITNAWANGNYGYGGVVQFQEDSDLLMRRVLFSDGGCDTDYYCYGGLIFWNNGGSATLEQVEVDGFSYDGSSYIYSWFPGLLYAYNVDVSVDGLNIHDLDITNVRTVYGAAFYQGYADLSVNDLWIHDNSFTDIYYSYGLSFRLYGVSETITLSNVTIENNQIEARSFYGTVGLHLGDSYGGSVVRNLEVLGNTVEVEEDAYPYGMGAFANNGEHDWQNLLVAGNFVEVEGYGYVYGGFAHVEYGSLYLANADMVDNTLGGVYGVYGSLVYSYQADVSMFNVTAANNDFGDAELYGGIYVESSSYVGGYNNVYEHATGDGWVYDDDDGDFVENLEPAYAVDPGYADAPNGDYSLSSSSPLIDAGSPDIPDPDGTVSDVGAYGGPYGDSW